MSDDDYTPDEKNPDLLFQGTHSELLIRALKGEIDLQELAARELANRGRDLNGNWIGFKAARQALGVK